MTPLPLAPWLRSSAAQAPLFLCCSGGRREGPCHQHSPPLLLFSAGSGEPLAFCAGSQVCLIHLGALALESVDLGEVLQLRLPSASPLVPSLLPRSSCGELRGTEGSKEHFELPTCSSPPWRSPVLPAGGGRAVEPRLPACCPILSPLLISLPGRGFDLGGEQPDRPHSACVSS